MEAKRVLHAWLAVEITAGLLAMVEFIALGPVIAYLAVHTLALLPAWGGLVVLPSALRFPAGVWKRAVSPVVAAVVLVVVTFVVALVLFVALSTLGK